ncbi:hypothetical protein [Cellvibrio mixtus]|uniref:hypothetical protein n=1 Tax=Cellvibrio mixtus TaxID=39650 RepID=UPI00190F090C|nr:hypothetical protein [Cellvibrio mixtus]
MKRTVIFIALFSLTSVAMAQTGKPPADSIHANVPVLTEKQKSRLPWSWQPVKNSEVPTPAHSSWVRTPIDAFILAKLEEKKNQTVSGY